MDPSKRVVEGIAADPLTQKLEEHRLVERARSGDQEAFRMLVEQHADRAYGLALRILRSREDAEEAAQDGFVRAWMALGTFRGESRFSTWLYRIVARVAIDRGQMLGRRRTRETGIEDMGDLAAPASADTVDESQARAVRRLIDTLSPAQRNVVTLFYDEGCSVEDVSQRLGMPTGTVKTHLSRARAALRAGLLREEGRSAS